MCAIQKENIELTEKIITTEDVIKYQQETQAKFTSKMMSIFFIIIIICNVIWGGFCYFQNVNFTKSLSEKDEQITEFLSMIDEITYEETTTTITEDYYAGSGDGGSAFVNRDGSVTFNGDS